jgi:hypothetical protein
MASNKPQELSEMSEKTSEKSEMSSVEFAQYAFQSRVAPPSLGSVKNRLRHAVSVMSKHERKMERDKRHWTANRVKDCWYADERISPNADEIRDLEDITGLRYGREQIREIDDLIRQADALLDSADPDFHSPFVAAMRSFVRTLAGSRTQG